MIVMILFADLSFLFLATLNSYWICTLSIWIDKYRLFL